MSLSGRVETISQLARQLEKHARSPTFDEDTLTTLSNEADQVRLSLVKEASDLSELVRGSLGPQGRLNAKLFGQISDNFAIRTIVDFKIAQAVPLEGSISYAELAEKLNINVHILTRLIRRAITINIFKEPAIDRVSHTADSRNLATDTIASNMIIQAYRSVLQYLWNGADAIKRWPHAEEPNETAYSLSINSNESFYESFYKDEENVRLFQDVMKYYARYLMDDVGSNYPWESLGTGKVVDIAGGKGSHTLKLAERFPALSFEVQDMEEVVKGLEAPNHLASRFQYRAHNMFHEQPVKGADVYYLSQILHNWPDKYCCRILAAIIPALKPGARILIAERIMPDSPYDPKYRLISEYDLQMYVCFNAKERSVKEFDEIFATTDKRFRPGKLYKSANGEFAIYESVWEP